MTLAARVASRYMKKSKPWIQKRVLEWLGPGWKFESINGYEAEYAAVIVRDKNGRRHEFAVYEGGDVEELR